MGSSTTGRAAARRCAGCAAGCGCRAHAPEPPPLGSVPTCGASADGVLSQIVIAEAVNVGHSRSLQRLCAVESGSACARVETALAHLVCILNRFACQTCVSSLRGDAPSAGSVAQLASAAARRRPGRRRAARDSRRTAVSPSIGGPSSCGRPADMTRLLRSSQRSGPGSFPCLKWQMVLGDKHLVELLGLGKFRRTPAACECWGGGGGDSCCGWSRAAASAVAALLRPTAARRPAAPMQRARGPAHSAACLARQTRRLTPHGDVESNWPGCCTQLRRPCHECTAICFPARLVSLSMSCPGQTVSDDMRTPRVPARQRTAEHRARGAAPPRRRAACKAKDPRAGVRVADTAAREGPRCAESPEPYKGAELDPIFDQS